MTCWHSVPNALIAQNLRRYQQANERHGCIPNGLLEEIIQRLELLEDTLEENNHDD